MKYKYKTLDHKTIKNFHNGHTRGFSINHKEISYIYYLWLKLWGYYCTKECKHEFLKKDVENLNETPRCVHCGDTLPEPEI